ncbi:MAG TPA: hypothetical protein VF546_16145 [Pyrinomonadaceae bacterium]|jgi:hypothetical protein
MTKRNAALVALLCAALLPVAARAQGRREARLVVADPAPTPAPAPSPAPAPAPLVAPPPASGGVTCCRVIWSVSLGKLSNGETAEKISISEAISPAIYKPSVLIYSPPGLKTRPGYSPEVDVIRNADGSLRQVKVPVALADVVAPDEWGFELRFYPAAQVGAKAGGLYRFSGAPSRVYQVRNPNPPAANRVQLSETKDGTTTLLGEWVLDEAGNACTMTKDGGAEVVTKQSVVNPADARERTDTFITRHDDKIVIIEHNTYYCFPWGTAQIKQVVEDDGEVETTVWTYYQDKSEEGRYGKVESITYPDGSWEVYDYFGDYWHGWEERIVKRGDKNTPRQP